MRSSSPSRRLASSVPWVIVFVAFAPLRRAMLWSSALALPFGLSELLFSASYWSPPTLFELRERVHLDIESFILLFAIGGLASVIFNLASIGDPICFLLRRVLVRIL